MQKNTSANRTVLSHVNCGGRPKYKSQYISTTSSLDTALHYKNKGEKEGLSGLRIAEIDLNNLPKSCKIIDLTSEENRDKYLGKAVCKNFAKASNEVLLQCDVAIPFKVIDPSEPKGKLLQSSGGLSGEHFLTSIMPIILILCLLMVNARQSFRLKVDSPASKITDEMISID